ncbi:senescence-associated carboxylesterase 101 isoform X2 [Rosa chinensis]|uniref:senescence-associated carboxylesterase 101 isoform X2 n=1 Tax=Rosa chinensis TaxID=74649 RepID=UPI000D097CA2|nr:senescence-associated carboxylesterase 101 isoform X2 [Rosa chinensis]
MPESFKMPIKNRFSSGLESGNLVVNSDPVHQAWCAIEQQRQINPNAEPSLYNEIQPENPIIIAFGTPPGSLQGQEGLVSSKDFAHFEFLCNKSNPVFCINEAAIKLFQSHYSDLLVLKNKLVENSTGKTPPLIIITGQSVGGIIATLFTLWLLEGLNLLKAKRPFCITFGSPLVGDEHLQKCVLEFSTWKYCFLHIVSNQDHTPKIFMSQNTTGAYKPFGTFLLCSASGCACSEDLDFVLEQFATTNSHRAQTQDPNLGFPYGQILEDLKRKALCNVFKSIGTERGPLEASMITQLLAIGAVSPSCMDIDNLVGKMKRHETKLLIQKLKNSDSDNKFNDVKIHMAYLEWYKKESKDKGYGYYDMYRKKEKPADVKVNEYKKKLMNYWEDSVTEIENRPQLEEEAYLRLRWLYGGTTYRRMVEPLHIADYYKDGGENYQTEDGKRPKHFTLLEKLHQEKQEQEEKKKEQEKKKKQETQKQEEKPESGPSKSKRKNVGSSLNDDSCFWARVEEALILLKKGGLTTDDKGKLKEFEDYVWIALKNYAVSPEIFLKKSSFMKWWNEYKEIVESSSSLSHFMKNGGPKEYEEGKFT